MSEDIRIYVADLAAYNNGILHGAWIDATHALDDIWTEVKAMLAASPVPDAEEFAIHDYEGFGDVQISEYAVLEDVSSFAQFIEQHGALGAAVLSHHCGSIDEARQALEEQYAGAYESVADFARELTEGTTQIPGTLEHYIDYDAMGRDIEMSGDVFTIKTAHNEVHVFWNHRATQAQGGAPS